MTSGHRPAYSEKVQVTCPRCTSRAISVLPENNPGSHQEWFRCGDCDHMWSHRRDRTEQGERSTPASSECEEDGA